MASNSVGIDIGGRQLKLAVCSGGSVRRLVVEDLPDNLVVEGRVVSPEAAAEFLKNAARNAKITTRNCSLVLPASVVFTQTMNLPMMSRDNLVLNLPYEFRDFITQEKDKYFYDYAVLGTRMGEDGTPEELELIAAATLKETIQSYVAMCRRAGFKLTVAIPEELALMNIIRAFAAEKGEAALNTEYCFLDLGHTATRMFIFRGLKLQATRVMEYGIEMVDRAISEDLNIDEHIARTYKFANTNNAMDSAACRNVFANIGVEVMRAVNFYRFNNPDNNLQEVFLMGGGSKIEPLVSQLKAELEMPLHRIDDILPDCSGSGDAALCPLAIGVAMQ